MLLEYCPGGELFNRLQKEVKLGNEAAVFYISEVVLAICYLHSKSIMYRDLKP
jgi:serine/threonine protein kinase